MSALQASLSPSCGQFGTPAAISRGMPTYCMLPAAAASPHAWLCSHSHPGAADQLRGHIVASAPSLQDRGCGRRSAGSQRPILAAVGASRSSNVASAESGAGTARQRVLDLIAGEHTNLRPNPDMAAAVDALIASGNTPDPGPATFRLGQGVWEVFYAPHIRTLSGLMLAEFSPIRYTLDGKHLYSNVGYKLPLGLARGWLSASGSLTADSTDSLKLRFDRFWVDRDPEPLRDTISADEAASGWDGFVTKVGSLTFFDGLATFPVLYVDEDLTVFRFSPLGVNIAAQRVK